MQIAGIKKFTKGRKLNPTAMHLKAQINRINTFRYKMFTDNTESFVWKIYHIVIYRNIAE